MHYKIGVTDLLSNRGHRPNIHINTHNSKYTYRVVYLAYICNKERLDMRWFDDKTCILTIIFKSVQTD